MATTKERFEMIDGRLDTIETTLSLRPIRPARPPANRMIRAWRWVVENKGTSLILSIILCVLGIYGKYYLDHKDDNFNRAVDYRIEKNPQLDTVTKKLTEMHDGIIKLQATLDTLQPFINEIVRNHINRISSLPKSGFEKSLSELKAIAQVAAQNKTPIPRREISDVGKRTIALASEDSNSSALAWDTTTALLQYQSVVDAFTPPINLDLSRPMDHYTTQYSIYAEPGLSVPALKSTQSAVPQEQAAALDYIGEDKNKNLPSGPVMLSLEGGNLTLDRMHLKNVVLIGVNVFYKGGALKLENVYFLNCTFQITRGANGVQLAGQIFANPDTHLSLS